MARIPYNVDAYTAKLIGRENLAKIDSAIIELVKNTYDADADVCILYLDEEKNTLYLCDNGTGMNKNTIIEHWMTIGHSSKIIDYKTKKGRVQTGSKGIGRFALDRIANMSTMYTATSEKKLIWKQDWSTFEPNKKITEIYAELDEVNIGFNEFCKDIKNEEVKKIISSEFKTGTIFKMENLQDNWDTNLFNRIKRTLQSIASPNLEAIFSMYLFNNVIDKENAFINSNIINQYDYKISFDVDEFGKATIDLIRNEFDLPKDFCKVLKLKNEDKQKVLNNEFHIEKSLDELLAVDISDLLKIGEFSGTLYFLKASISKGLKEEFLYKDITGRKNSIKEFGGIKIYRDNFRVRPYGDYGTEALDWLMLSARKAASPAGVTSNIGSWKVRGEQMLGQVNISRTNLRLADQSNREGIVETKEFNLFKDMIIAIISILERDRQYMVKKTSEYTFSKSPNKKNQAVLTEFLVSDKEKYDKNYYKKIKPAIKAVIEEKEKQISALENEISMLTSLATTGIVTNTYIHELKGFSSKLFTKICNAKETLEYLNYDILEQEDKDDFLSGLNMIKESYKYNNVFNSWFGITIGSISKDRRKMKKHNISKLLSEQIESWSKVLESKEIKIDFNGDDSIEVRCFPYELDSIISNLITNSISAFESDRFELNGEKEINISLRSDLDGFIIEYNDNGPGLVKLYKNNPKKILEAFESEKRSILGENLGTGMGMWIIKRNVDLYKGVIDLKDNINKEFGFYIKIKINARR
ncbi:sensor histidine kinase [Clostridium perfringens]|uniref:sensor histidine kinase n=1 Tax=Clostridium perfringens TaxID=1502 RepID=UPI002054CC76|nr:sensor histidine kinase [Clostridium perfringens]DAW21692.1 MAG TPA: Histidine kinase-, DNA gyrase B-, and HSP90-like ATPase [Caudoviricetes sp.]ELC8435515.1 sensor histidine kinase [Clostridium perfringens]MDH2471270.1 sensor histidine kinase [Clostridium perfringens]MDU6697663.1 sensor histidine kinase [Clostridium perfringens]MDU7784434.1 sensor histidine kinase [Clostridium perfringens]